MADSFYTSSTYWNDFYNTLQTKVSQLMQKNVYFPFAVGGGNIAVANRKRNCVS